MTVQQSLELADWIKAEIVTKRMYTVIDAKTFEEVSPLPDHLMMGWTHSSTPQLAAALRLHYNPPRRSFWCRLFGMR